MAPFPGSCKASITRFFYDGLICRAYKWGGCATNFNNFKTRETCERSCHASCASYAFFVNETRVEGEAARKGERKKAEVNSMPSSSHLNQPKEKQS
ncbi:CLUMA_CG002831, isoform A [Clunio marinus]|uniref:CLUMA_CG002831, isoform A n=1 Tax=Clunio marinus TaxID=568069 RepID=A0A1J1HM60_9DIPT|nr:CLUMA_CG002831, isoform A [Clunio marinus]